MSRMRAACLPLIAAVALVAGTAACGDPGVPVGSQPGTTFPSATPSAAHHPSPATAARPTPSATPRPSGTAPSSSAPLSAAAAPMPHPDHVVVVVMENRSFNEIIGSSRAPYINELARGGALFTQSYAVTHPSQPNYLALFSGSPQGVTSDSCPHTFTAANLGRSMVAAGRSFAGYSEGLPAVGSLVCANGSYARKHAPWVNFPSVPRSANAPFTAFPSSYAALPHLSFVIPDLDHDMHDGTVLEGDQWLRSHLGSYATWAATHNSLLVLTWDEDDRSESNRVVTVIAGAHVRPGRYAERVDHYRLLSTLERLERVPRVGRSISAAPVTSIWAP
jgi:acid phosphatase